MTLSVSSYPITIFAYFWRHAWFGQEAFWTVHLVTLYPSLAFLNIDTLQGKPRQTGVRGHKWEWTWLQLPRRNQSHHRQHERNLTLTLRGASWGQQILPISHTRVRLIYNEDLLLELSAYKSTNK